MKTILAILLLAAGVSLAAPPPVIRNPWTTNPVPLGVAGMVTTSDGVTAVWSNLPAPAWGALMLGSTTGASKLNLNPLNQHFTITNYSLIVLSNFTGSAAEGNLTNSLAGFYAVQFSLSTDSVGNQRHIHGHLATNDVHIVEIGYEMDNTTGGLNTSDGAAHGIVYLPANTRISHRIADSGATGFVTNVQATLVLHKL